MSSTLTRDRLTPPPKRRKVPGSNSEPVIVLGEVVQIPKPKRVVTVKPEHVPFFQRYAWLLGVLGFALAAWPLGALIGSVVR